MTLRFITWNVQHGSAALVQTPNRQQIAIDLGADENFSPLRYLKYRMGINQLDKVIITHPHMDHVEDISNFDLLCPRILMTPRHLNADDINNGHYTVGPEAAQIYQKYLDVNARYTVPVQPIYDPSIPANNGGVSIASFFPSQSPKTNLNNHSIVTVIEYEGVKILSPGDNEPPSWDELLADEVFREAIRDTHVLVAPHHGRESGYHGDLFDHISPTVTIISDGRTVDTSATDRYSAKTKGWDVQRKTGIFETRKCVTTRKDGTIVVIIKPNLSGIGSIQVIVDG